MENTENTLLTNLFADLKKIFTILLVVFFLLGIGIRLYDLTDAPFDFNPSRQLRGAIIARGIYYQMLPDADPVERSTAISLKNGIADFEPQILESIVAGIYLLTGQENFWVARIVNTLFWMVGGWFLFKLAQETSSSQTALAALGLYLFLPFSVYASRSFQPDPLMTVLIVLSAYAAYRWAQERTWKWALWAGALGGLAALVKIVAAFLVGGMMLAVGLGVVGFRKAVKDKQLWAIAALVILPAFIYYILVRGQGAASYYESWGIALSSLILKPTFYFQWLDRLESLISPALIFAGVVGVLLSRPPLRAILIGLWIGYIVYGLSLPHLIITHDYYSLQLVPVLALSLAPLADALFNRVAQENKFWHWVFIGLMALAVAFPLWTARSALLGQDYRKDAVFWGNFREILPPNGNILALTQHYGHPIAYYSWQRVNLWPTTQELNLAQLRGTEKGFEKFFDNKAQKNDYFLVTSKNQLSQQPELEEILLTYPVIAEGGGYILFDIRGEP